MNTYSYTQMLVYAGRPRAVPAHIADVHIVSTTHRRVHTCTGVLEGHSYQIRTRTEQKPHTREQGCHTQKMELEKEVSVPFALFWTSEKVFFFLIFENFIMCSAKYNPAHPLPTISCHLSTTSPPNISYLSFKIFH